MPAGVTTVPKNEDKQPTRSQSKPEATETPKPKESAVSSSSSSSAKPAEPTSPPSDKDEIKAKETPVTTSNESPSTPTPAASEDGDVIDMETFQQIIDLDDPEDEEPEFARGMVEAYFEQAEDTFSQMDAAFGAKDLAQLSSLGHFLKGSSAALGVQKVTASCEDIQHYGQRRDEQADRNLTTEQALSKIHDRISEAKRDHAVAEQWLKNWFDKRADEAE